MRRVHRRWFERFWPAKQRYRCVDASCLWEGLIGESKWPAWGLALPKRTVLLGVLGVSLLLVAAATGWWLHRPAKDERVMVGPHVVNRGTHLEGDQLPSAHPLRKEVPAALLEREPEGFSEAPKAMLHVRRHCAWGLPGRNPYRGSVEQALRTAQLSETVVKAIAADIKAGRKVDRVTISNDRIVAHKSGRVFDARRVAMTYGMTLCVDTRVNFKPGHTEGADLYEAIDDDGRVYAVMVPEVCGNVSVLGQEFVKNAPEGAQDDARPWMRLPPELRPRMLPDKLRFFDKPPGGKPPDGGNDVPEPGSLLLAALALAAAAWSLRRTGRKR